MLERTRRLTLVTVGLKTAGRYFRFILYEQYLSFGCYNINLLTIASDNKSAFAAVLCTGVYSAQNKPY